MPRAVPEWLMKGKLSYDPHSPALEYILNVKALLYMADNAGGRLPVSLLLLRSKVPSLPSVESCPGMVPVSAHCESFSVLIRVRVLSCSGISPENMFPPSCKFVRSVSSESWLGICPLKNSFWRMKDWRFVRSETDGGIVPEIAFCWRKTLVNPVRLPNAGSRGPNKPLSLRNRPVTMPSEQLRYFQLPSHGKWLDQDDREEGEPHALYIAFSST